MEVYDTGWFTYKELVQIAKWTKDLAGFYGTTLRDVDHTGKPLNGAYGINIRRKLIPYLSNKEITAIFDSIEEQYFSEEENYLINYSI